MMPSARVQAALEILTALGGTRLPADRMLADYFRTRRYAGSKDRSFVVDIVYGVLRHQARLDWWVYRALGDLSSALIAERARVIAFLHLAQGRTVETVRGLFDGSQYGAKSLNTTERELLSGLEKLEVGDRRSITHPDQPSWVSLEYPEWLDAAFRAQFGDDLGREMAAAREEARLELRVNTLKADLESAQVALEAEGVETTPTGLSPIGLAAKGRPPMHGLVSYKAGQVEIQAEASQVAALLADAKPGMRIVDFCAGAGGKTLALAACMNNRGRLIACDTDKGRLEAASRRLRRAGVANAETRVLSSARDKWVKRHKNSFDVVFVDAPCSGSGTWRRNPDAKWRFTEQDLEELSALQAEILDSACRLVRPGGRLVYATCSLLHRENEEQVTKFQSAHDDFSTVPIRAAWSSAFGQNGPDLQLAEEVDTLTLTTARHGTDGFFVAVMERAKEPEPASSDSAEEPN